MTASRLKHAAVILLEFLRQKIYQPAAKENVTSNNLSRPEIKKNHIKIIPRKDQAFGSDTIAKVRSQYIKLTARTSDTCSKCFVKFDTAFDILCLVTYMRSEKERP